MSAMFFYVSTIATPQRDLPWFGDSDDGRGFLCSPHETNLQVVMDLGGLLFSQPQWLDLASHHTSASRALLPVLDQRRPSLGATTITKPGLFKEAGIGVLEGRNGAKLIMDFGPLGYTAIAAHGHSDALSFVLA